VDPYDKLEQMRSGDVAEKIAAIWDDATDRKGVKHELQGCDEDIQIEIMDTWIELVRGLLP
jgi:hypothetical protein